MKPERWARIKAISYEAVEQSAEERAAFIRSRCDGDETLALEIESLLVAHDRAGSFIEGLPNVSTTTLNIQPPDKMIGQRIGAYEVIREIGRGGMGAVYLAQDTRLGRQVALKLLRDEFTTDQPHIRRFEQEARAASALNHPNIVTIYDIGEAEIGRFIIMEFIEGRTLQEVASKSLSLEELVKLVGQVAKALNEAHRAGIIHRDIKPENIMVRNDGYVKVLDFGVARLAATRAAGVSVNSSGLETASGVIIGTPAYMSPEQAGGKPITGATDIFSLGIVLYELATEQHPFKRESLLAFLHAIVEEQPNTPSGLNHEISLALETLILRMLEKDPLLRPDAGEVTRILTEIETGDSKGAGTEGVRSRKEKFELGTKLKGSATSQARSPFASVGKRVALALALTTLVIVIAGIAYRVWITRQPPINSLAVLPFVNTSGDPSTEYLSDGITESIIYNLSKISTLKVMSRSSVYRYKGKEIDVPTAARELGVRAVLTGKIVQVGDNILISCELVDAESNTTLWGQHYNRKLADIFSVQEESAKEISEKLRLRLKGEEQNRLTKRYTQNAEAYQLYLKGRYYWNKKDQEGLKKGIEHFQQAIGIDPAYALAYSGLADSYLTLYDYGFLKAEEANPNARAAAKKALEIDDQLAEAHNSLAHLSLHDWEWADAEREFKRAIDLDPSYVLAHHWYALCLTAMGRLDEALAEIKRAQELDPFSLRINADVGMALFASRKYDEAIEQERKTLEMDSNFRTAYFIAGLAYEQKGMFNEAIREFGEALKRAPKSPNLLASLGHAYALAGRKDDARKILNELEERSKGGGVSPFFIALIYTGLGEKDSAFNWLDQACKERSGSVRYFKVEPRLDSLRSDPRFTDLIHRVGLTP